MAMQDSHAWVDMMAWGQCGRPVDAEELRGRPCYVGFSREATGMSALVALFPPADAADRYRLIPRFYIPEETFRSLKGITQEMHHRWAASGHLVVTPDRVVDMDVIQRDLAQLVARFDVREIARDPWTSQQVGREATWLGIPQVDVPWGYATLSGPTKRFQELVLADRLDHGNHPVLNWLAAGTVIRDNGSGAIRPCSVRSTVPIDGAHAILMALARAEAADDRKIPNAAAVVQDTIKRLEHLQVKDGDVLVIEYRKARVAVIEWLVERLSDHLDKRGLGNTLVLLVENMGEIRTLDEGAMRRYGWVKAGRPDKPPVGRLEFRDGRQEGSGSDA